jgi:hypothetical protein
MGWSSRSGPAGEIGAITVLKNQPDSDKALKMLKELAEIVKPVMKKHGWYLPQLSEFFPKQTNLLGAFRLAFSRFSRRFLLISG